MKSDACWPWCSPGRGWRRRRGMWAGVGPAALMDFPQPVGLCVRTQALGFFFFFFFSYWGNLFLFLKMHKLRVISFLFCSFSIQFAPGINSLPFLFVGVVLGRWWMTKQLLGAVNCNTELLPPRTLFWANVECVFSDSKALQVHGEVIWGLHSAFNLRKLSMNNLGSWNVTWEWRLWATN